MKNRLNAIIPLVLFILISVGPARATTVIPPSFSELVATAQTIVEAEVVAIRSERTPYGAGHVIHTYVTIDVLEVLKGTAGDTVELKLLGGSAEGVTMRVEGVPTFQIGQRDVLFIENNGTQYCPLVGIMHGRYPILEENGVPMVHRSNGIPLTSPADVQLSLGYGGSLDLPEAVSTGDSGLTLAEFQNHIQEELNNAQAK